MEAATVVRQRRNKRPAALLALFLVFHLGSGSARAFDQPVYLQRIGDHVWLREPPVYVAMMADREDPSAYRLTPEAARSFEPLVTRVLSSGQQAETLDRST